VQGVTAAFNNCTYTWQGVKVPKFGELPIDSRAEGSVDDEYSVYKEGLSLQYEWLRLKFYTRQLPTPSQL